jgi:hypothetical protein
MFGYSSEKKFLFVTTIIFFICGCANIVTPTGGEKDLIPPEIIQERPPNKSINFNSKEIRISFDEYIVLRNPLRQIIISPPLTPSPEYQIKQRTLLIKLPDSLNPNTTYTINFGNSIVDNTEGNPLPGYQYIFSTGSFIDSLFITGKVTNAFTNEPVKDVTVMLYAQQDDSLPYKSRPSYFARTSENGVYRISNIKANDYKIFALKDENTNYIFDQPSELIGFKKEPVNPADTIQQDIKVFLNEPEEQRLINTITQYPGRMVMIFNMPVGEITYAPLSGSQLPEIKYQEFSADRDTLFIWAADTTLDSLNFVVLHNDAVLDTLLVPIRRGRTQDPTQFNYTISTGRSGAMPPGDSIRINFNNPVHSIDTSLISVLKDSLTAQQLQINYTDTNTRRVVIDFPSEENTKHHLIILPGAFTDIYGNQNDTINQQLNIRSLRDFGSLSLIFNPGDTANYLIQLIDLKGNIAREVKYENRQINFELLNPGEYRIKAITDENNNGRWDTGNYLRNKQPEDVLFFNETITIRANWFVDQTWNILK